MKINITIDNSYDVVKLNDHDLYNLENEVRKLLRFIYEEEYNRGLLKKYNITTTKVVLGTNLIGESEDNSKTFTTKRSHEKNSTDKQLEAIFDEFFK